MLKTLVIMKLKSLFLQTTKSSSKKGNTLAKTVLYLLLFGYVGIVFLGMFYVAFDSLVEPLKQMNLLWCYFAYMTIVIMALCFIGSVFLTYNEIYEGKDNELLMSLPIKTSDILLSRICLIVLINYLYEFVIAAPALYVYITRVGMNIIQIIFFMIAFITLPLFVIACSCLFGWILAHILVHVRNKNTVMLILSLGFFGLYFKLVMTLENDLIWILGNGDIIADMIQTYIYPIYQLSQALTTSNLLSFVIYLLVALIPFVVVVRLLSVNYIKLATSKPKAKKKEYKQATIKSLSLMQALILREFKHFMSHAMIILNGGLSIFFNMVAIIALILYKDTIYTMLPLMEGIDVFLPWIIVLANISMASMNLIGSAIISIEGNRFYILKSLPITLKNIIDSKLLFSICLFTPTTIIFTIIAGIIVKISLLDLVLCLLLSLLFILFVALVGMLTNLWIPKLDYMNEIICIKQSIPSLVTMVISMGLTALMIFGLFNLYGVIDMNIFMIIVMIVLGIIDLLVYYMINTWGIKRLDEL